MMNVRDIGVIVVGISALSVVGGFLYADSGSSHVLKGLEHTIVLTDSGFSPEEITLQQGSTVTFKTTRGESFWPASNLHPTHEIYSAFDPKQPISAEESWSFTFDTPGRWRFHDHLFANYTGAITVVEKGKKSATKKYNETECSEIVIEQNKQQCWDNKLEEVLEEEGLDAAFDFFIELYRTEPGVPKGCHGWGHVLGEAAYKLFSDKEDVVFHEEASYCGYGFYHGFIEQLILDNPDVSATYDFCQSIRNSIPDNVYAYKNCIHGIGHGTTAMIVSDPVMWGDLQGIIDGGIGVCERILYLDEELRECYDGVFNELSLDVYGSEYGFDWSTYLSQGKPLWICHLQKKSIQTSCFFEFIGTFRHIFSSFQESALFVQNDISDLEDAKIGIRKHSADNMQHLIVNDSYEESVSVCRSLRSELRYDCFQGIIIGLFAHGEPGSEYKKIVPFCGALYLNEREKNQCYQETFHKYTTRYTPDLIDTLCREVPKEYYHLTERVCKGT